MRPKVCVNAAGTTTMASSSTKLVSAVGFSNGCAAVDVEKTAAVGAEVFDELQCGNRPLGYGLRTAFHRVRDGVRQKIHRDALRNQKHTAQQRHRQ